MTIFDDLRKISSDLDVELGTEVLLTPMVRNPNGRLRPDTSRAPLVTVGIFHEHPRSAGDGRFSRDGLNETSIKSVVPSISIRTDLLRWKPTQGDTVSVPELGRTFRVLDMEREMHTRTRLLLENLEPNLAA
jgi:hypothetical protein